MTNLTFPGVDISQAGLGVNPNLFNVKPSNTRKMRNGLAQVRRGTRNSKIACVGDSVTRGQKSVATTAQWAANGWPPQLAVRLAATGLPIMAQNVIGDGNFASVSIANVDPRLSATGGWAGNSGAKTAGGQAFKATAAGTLSFTPTVSVDTFEVVTLQSTAAFSLSLNVDGGAATVLNTSNANNLLKSTVAAGALAAHTLNGVWGSGQNWIVGIDAYNSAQKSVQLLNMGASSWKASDWADATNVYGPINTLKFYAVDAAFILLGLNDSLALADPTAYTTNIQALITSVKLTGDPIIVVMPPADISNASVAVQQAYVAAAYALAVANDIPLIDLYALWGGDDAVAQALGWKADGVHPNQYGYHDWMLLIFQMLQLCGV